MSKRNKSASSSKGRRLRDFSNVVTVPVRGWLCWVQQGTSGTGGLSSTIIGTFRNVMTLDPFNMGARMLQLAECFAEWRIKGDARFRYLPHTGSNGLLPLPSGTSTSSNVRAFYWGVSNDSASALPATATTIPSFGGTVGRTCAPSSVVGRSDNVWRYTSTTSASPSLPDVRQAAPLELMFSFEGASTTVTQVYGSIMIECTVQFRGPAYAGLLGLPAASPSPPSVQTLPADEKSRADGNNSPSGEKESLSIQFAKARRPLLDAKALQNSTISGESGAKDRVTGGAWW